MTPALNIILRSGIDQDTRAWRDAVNGAGGSVSASWVRSVDQFVRGCKADGIWDSLLDVGLLCGADNLSGALVKLKTPSGVSRVLTNNNFVSGDYTPSGSTAGLLGNGTSKYLNTNFNPVTQGSSTSSFHLAAYVLGTESGAITRMIAGAIDGSSTNANYIGWISTSTERVALMTNANVLNFGAAFDGFYAGDVSASVLRAYKNGVAHGTTAVSNGSATNRDIFLFCYNLAGTPSAYSTRRIKSYSIGNGLSAAQWEAYSQRINALMATIGANQY